MVWTVSVVSCTPLPKPFSPQTPDEQAVARTVVTFLAAVKTQDMETLNTLVFPDATMAAFVDGSREPPQSIRASLLRANDSPLLHAAANKLVDFRQASPMQASVGAYVTDIVNAPYRGTDQVTTRIRWDLVERDGQWRIQHLAQTTWITPYNAAGAGP
jgi:hypothetical protein